MDEGGSIGFSDLIKVKVEDCLAREVGHVQDMALADGVNSPDIGYLGVHFLWTDRVGEIELVRRAEDVVLLIEWSDVASFSEDLFTLKCERPDFPVASAQDKVLLRQDLLNKQMVDPGGTRIQRVDDIQLVFEGGKLKVSGLEVSKGMLITSSALRRYMTRIRHKHAARGEPETIPWAAVHKIEEDAIVITEMMRSDG